MTTTKKRIEFIDLAKGICILLVVLLHVDNNFGEAIKIMSIFRMPLYFVLSGMFFKTYESFYNFTKKKTNKLLIPFLSTFFIISIPTSYWLNSINGFDTTISTLFFAENDRLNLGINGASWFLICLFIVNIIFYIIFLLSRHNVIVIAIIGGICGITGYLLNVYELYLPMWLDSSLTATPFFIIGYAIKQYSDILYEQFSNKHYFLLIGAFIALLIIYKINEYETPSTILFIDNNFNVNIISLYIGGMVGTYCVLLIAKYFKYLPVISYLGRYSIVVLLTHQFYIFIVRNILYQLNIPQNSFIINLGIFIFIIIISLPTIKFCIKYLPYCFAQKDLWK